MQAVAGRQPLGGEIPGRHPFRRRNGRTEETGVISKGLMEGLIDALSYMHSQLDVRLQGLMLSVGDSRLAVHLSGTISLAIHLRDLTDAEMDAHATANVASIQP